MKFIKIIPILLLFLASSCNKDNDKKNNNYKYKNDQQLIESFYKNIVQPEIKDFEAKADTFLENINSFVATPNSEKVNTLRANWLILAKKYAEIYTYNIGDIKDRYYVIRFNNWPTSNSSIENFIQNKEITKENISRLGSSAKGLPAIEYLLFNKNSEETAQEFTTNTKRKNYLQLITEELTNNAHNQTKLWEQYSKTLAESNITGADNSFNILFNGINNVIHNCWETKIGKPAGFLKSKGTNIDKLEAKYSKKSLALIKANVLSVEKAFFDDSIVAISDKIKFITKDEKINTLIKNQFKKVHQSIDAIDVSLYDAVTTENDKVRKLFNELKQLEAYFTSDVTSALSLIITGTDGDGD